MKAYTRADLVRKMLRLDLDWVYARTGRKDRSQVGNFFVAMSPVVLGAQGNETIAKWRCVRSGGRDSLWVKID
jgi:hypothetical protein